MKSHTESKKHKDEPPMNEFLRCRRDCFLGVKAFQNIQGSLSAFNRFCTLGGSDDYLLLSSIFHLGIIRYAKPFLHSESSTGRITYPIKGLKKLSGFSMQIHDHIITVRNTLVAHDDFEQIEPRMLGMSLRPEKSSVAVPLSIIIANKCVSYPCDMDAAQKIRDHVTSALRGVAEKLSSDISRIQSIAIEHPDQAKDASKYSKDYGQFNMPVSGKELNLERFLTDPWLNPIEPDFSGVHKGFVYEQLTFQQRFS